MKFCLYRETGEYTIHNNMADIERTYYAKLAVRDALCRDLENKREALLSEAASLNDTTMMVKRSLADTTWKAYQNLQTELISLCMNAEDIPELLSDGEYTSHIYVDILTVIEEGSIKREVKEEPDAVEQSLDTSMEVQLTGKEARVKYQNIIDILFKMLNNKFIEVADPNNIMSLVRRIQRDLINLDKYDLGVEHWSPLVCAIMLRKLDKNTQQDWYNSDFRGATPNHNSLIEFLTVYSRALNYKQLPANSSVHRRNDSNVEHNSSRPSLDNNKDYKTLNKPALRMPSRLMCRSLCGGMDHGNDVRKCPKLISMTWDAKIRHLRHNGLCIKCVQLNHANRRCKISEKCSLCGSLEHDKLVCPFLRTKWTSCVMCNSKEHLNLTDCTKFAVLSVKERKQVIRKHFACFKCLDFYHDLVDCTSETLCHNCRQNHHTLLCLKNADNASVSSSKPMRACIMCKSDCHSNLNDCPSFSVASLTRRQEIVKINRICFICLSIDHVRIDCTSQTMCDLCGCAHHSLICKKLVDNVVNSTVGSLKTESSEMESFEPPLNKRMRIESSIKMEDAEMTSINENLNN